MIIDRYKSHSNSRNKRKRAIKYLFLFTSLLIIISSIILFFFYKENILFYFQKDKYQSYFLQLEQQKLLLTNKVVLEKKEKQKIDIFIKHIGKLKMNNKADAILYYLEGSLWYFIFQQKINQVPQVYSRHLFNQFINKSNMQQLFANDWRKALFNLRKANLLNLPSQYRYTSNLYINNLYFWDNHNYWPNVQKSVTKLLKNSRKDKSKKLKLGVDLKLLHSLFSVLSHTTTPNWEIINKKFGDKVTYLWRGIYHLNQRNTPLAFSNLQNITSNSDDAFFSNSAYYLLSQIMKKQRKKKRQLYYYSKIDLAQFLSQQKWFLGEYYALLLHFGDRKKANSVLRRFEKLTLN